MKEPKQISARLTAGGQPSEADLRQLAQAGFTAVINLRRDGEANQPLSPAAEGDTTKSLGLDYHHLPVSIAELRPEQVEEFRRLVAQTSGPVYVHCGGGQRACAFALLAEHESAERVFHEAAAKDIELPDAPVRDFIGEYFKRR